MFMVAPTAMLDQEKPFSAGAIVNVVDYYVGVWGE